MCNLLYSSNTLWVSIVLFFKTLSVQNFLCNLFSSLNLYVAQTKTAGLKINSLKRRHARSFFKPLKMFYVLDTNLDTMGILCCHWAELTKPDDSSNTKKYEINLHNRVWHSGCGLLNGKLFLKTIPANDSKRYVSQLLCYTWSAVFI